eukprot:s3607_g2.t1
MSAEDNRAGSFHHDTPSPTVSSPVFFDKAVEEEALGLPVPMGQHTIEELELPAWWRQQVPPLQAMAMSHRIGLKPRPRRRCLRPLWPLSPALRCPRCGSEPAEGGEQHNGEGTA